jgi:hypothetical protein
MAIQIREPIKKEKNYIAKITNELNKQIRIKISDAVFMSLNSLEGGGRTMRIYINDNDTVNNVSSIDDQVRKITIEKNQDWFNNNLTNETIDQLFRNSMNKTNNTMLVLISDTNEPSVYVNGVTDEDFNINNIKSKTPVSLVIEAQGLLIYPKKFGIRWIVRSIYISNNSNDDTQEHIYIDKESIEESWKSDIVEMGFKIDADISILESRIKELNNLRSSITNYYETAIKEDSINSVWHESLNLITKKYTLYLNGSL